MSLLHLVIALIIVGVLLWAFNTYVTMIDAKIKKLINVVVIVAVVIWVLYAFGVMGHIHDVPVPKI
jgi:type IV secretory pathway TrbL component